MTRSMKNLPILMGSTDELKSAIKKMSAKAT
jgi:hypothetical protein